VSGTSGSTCTSFEQAHCLFSPAQNRNTMPQDSGARLKAKRKATLKLMKRKAETAEGGAKAPAKARQRKGQA